MKKLLALCFAALFAASAQAQVGLSGYPPPGQLPGTVTNDAAAAGNVGELKSSPILAGSQIALTTQTAANLTSLALTPGDWDVSCAVTFSSAATTSVVINIASLSLTASALDLNPGKFSEIAHSSGGTVLGAATDTMVVGPYPVSVAANTTYNCVGYSQFTVSTMNMYGYMRARRVR